MFQFNLAVVEEREGNGNPYQCDRCYPVRHVSGRSRSFVAAINHAAASITEENRPDRPRAQNNLEAANNHIADQEAEPLDMIVTKGSASTPPSYFAARP